MSQENDSKFLKKYASSLKNTSGRGVWSGRGIGIPVAGAVDGSADGSKYLGRPRRPLSPDSRGSTSQSADSSFSSYLTRVNKNYDVDDERYPMFPDQEIGYYDDLEYIYKMHDMEPLVTSKLQSPRPRRISEKSSEIPSRLISEQWAGLDVELANIFGDTIRQSASAADGIDWLILIPSTIKNYIEIKAALSDAEDLLADFEENPTPELAENLENVALSLTIDVMDILQIIAEAVIPSVAGTAVSVSLSGHVARLGRLKDIFNTILTGGGPLGAFARDLGFRAVLRSGASNFNRMIQKTPAFARPFISFFIDAIETLAEIEEKIEEYDKENSWDQTGGSRLRSSSVVLPGSGDFSFDEIESAKKAIASLTPTAKATLAAAGGIAAMLGLIRAAPDAPRGALEVMIDNLTESTAEESLRTVIRDVLREYVVYQPHSLHPPAPVGYEFYSPPVADEESEPEGKIYDEYAVIVPGDEGVSTYSPRPTNESELRVMIKDMLSETKKKIRKSPRKRR
jgi:hypothetical protein